MREALVVVLGDLSRSPRMQNHCVSLATTGNLKVTALSTVDKASAASNQQIRDLACNDLETNDNIHVQVMQNPPSNLPLPIKAIWQAALLIYNLCFLVPRPNVIIVQNPPSIPTLPVVWLYSRIVGAKFVIDWHNYGFTILSLKLSPSHHLVKFMKFIEIYFGRLADVGFTVTAAMKQDLEKNYKFSYPLHILYDKPPQHFKPLRLKDRHKFLLKIESTLSSFTPMSEHFDEYKLHRPAIIFSSTSWTEDEDFGLLFDALSIYDSKRELCLQEDSYPSIVCVITGKGPLKSHWESKIPEYKFRHVKFELPWLPCEDYAKMIACSDIGISLHTSSSGVDLPMKVVDMFGCGVPVLAFHYPTIKELVVENFYGLTFSDSTDLFEKLLLLLRSFHSEEGSQLGRYSKNIKRHFLVSRWEDNWTKNVGHVFRD